MSKQLVWDQVGEKLYQTGIEQVALYPQDEKGAYPLGVAWNGVTNITDTICLLLSLTNVMVLFRLLMEC